MLIQAAGDERNGSISSKSPRAIAVTMPGTWITLWSLDEAKLERKPPLGLFCFALAASIRCALERGEGREFVSEVEASEGCRAR